MRTVVFEVKLTRGTGPGLLAKEMLDGYDQDWDEDLARWADDAGELELLDWHTAEPFTVVATLSYTYDPAVQDGPEDWPWADLDWAEPRWLEDEADAAA